ncbi:alpha/beta fold hydrolase [Arthrobacter alpinus]|uniref:alpha/beta fold hydrolase n=1 Tax=Arthrobacter alpinus TaxID=656366 RepID=UPI0009FB4FA0|nr:alpha/beta fold hydrolase [Arthrobacter alpinus]
MVVLHGLAGESGEFAPTMAALAQQYRVVALDQRGHGRSTRRPFDVSRDAFVQDVVALIAYVSPGAPVHLAGQSMGAHTAMLVAAARPDLIDSLVLLESDAGSGSLEDAAKLGAFFASWPVPFADAAAALAFLGDSPVASAWVKSMQMRDNGLWPRFDSDVMERCIRHVMQPRWDDWISVQSRALVVYADGGMFTEAQKQEFVSRRPGTIRVDLQNASHDAHLDQFEAWMDALRGFLNVTQKVPPVP